MATGAAAPRCRCVSLFVFCELALLGCVCFSRPSHPPALHDDLSAQILTWWMQTLRSVRDAAQILFYCCFSEIWLLLREHPGLLPLQPHRVRNEQQTDGRIRYKTKAFRRRGGQPEDDPLCWLAACRWKKALTAADLWQDKVALKFKKQISSVG